MIVTAPREKLWAFANKRLGVAWSSDYQAFGVVRDDCLCAVVGYNGWAGRTCFAHTAIDDPSVITRTFVKACLDYPFRQCGITHILSLIEEGNTRSLEGAKRIGFREINRFENASKEGDKAILQLVLARNECRYFHGQ